MASITPELGLVCITKSEAVRFRTITRKRLQGLDPAAQRNALTGLYAANVQALARAVTYCRAEGVRLYRLTSQLLPFSDTAQGAALMEEMADPLGAVGDAFTAAGIRVLMHPDQYVVLNSETPSVVDNAITILTAQARQLDLLRQPRSAWAPLEVHGGKGGRSQALCEAIAALPDPIRSRLCLENDERAYGARDILAICHAAGVPMVFDAHHHVVHEGLDSYDHPSVAEALAAARETWPDPAWQVVHISNGRESFRDPHHSDVIDVMPESYRRAPWIEVEAKHKEIAIAGLRREWLSTLTAGP